MGYITALDTPEVADVVCLFVCLRATDAVLQVFASLADTDQASRGHDLHINVRHCSSNMHSSTGCNSREPQS